ncbi:MAG: polysaccharide deacetylase family protein [Flavobacteriaceae bacterium]|nr:polysaccharide deacetylase family protein [Flavobacteriaceae bacterium]
MKAYFTKTPKLIQKIFSEYIWSMGSNKKEIYLTFDDGPHPEITPWVLKILANYNAKATFFCIGENMLKYPKVFSQILKQKHCTGNHTFNHLNGWKTDNISYFNNIEQAEEIFREKKREKREERREKGEIIRKFKSQIIKAKFQNSKLFRPPYGKIKPSQAKTLLRTGYQIIMWDVLSADFDKNISKEKCLQNVLKNTQNGSVIVFHDSEKAFKNLEYVLPKVLRYFSEKGFVFRGLEGF